MRERPAGFTLLELLVVVAVMAVVAGGLLVAYGGVDDAARADVGRAELEEVRRAVLRFRADTGHLPKTGPFDLDLPGRSADAAVDPATVPGASDAEKAAWFDSPANLGQLFQNPLLDEGGDPTHALAAWNRDTRRGWRGPYLKQAGEGWVAVGAALGPDGGGDPTAGAVLVVQGVADPHDRPPVGAYLAWASAEADLPAAPHPRWGRPYLLLGLDDPLGPAGVRLVGFGPDGAYDLAADDDVVLHVR